MGPPVARAGGRRKPPVDITAVTQRTKYYELDNSLLRSKSYGIHLRSRPSILENDLSTPLLKWGTVLRAEPVWSECPRDDTAVEEAELSLRDIYGRTVPIVEEPSEWLLVTGVRNLRGRTDGVTKRWFMPWDIAGVPVLIKRDDVEDDTEPEEEQPQQGSREIIPQPTPGPPPGTGLLYQVLFEQGVVVRSRPSLTALPLSREPEGAVVELFDWDESRLWRSVHDRQGRLGWMLLDHPDLGPLLRPQVLPFQVRPVEPMCAAALEGSLRWLRCFINEGLDVNVRDAGDRTPLMVASEYGQRGAAVVLCAAGAVTGAKSSADHNASDIADSEVTEALVRALGDQKFDPQLCQQAIDGLDEEVRDLAEDLLSRRVAKAKFFARKEAPKAQVEPKVAEGNARGKGGARAWTQASAKAATKAAAKVDVEALAERGRCALCQKDFRQAVLAPCCVALFCSDCILARLAGSSEGNVCPGCNTEISTDKLDFLSPEEANERVRRKLRQGRDLR